MRVASIESRAFGGARRRALLAVLVAAAPLAFAQAAGANVGETIFLRCTHNESLAGFSQSAYDQALKDLNADAEEYSRCAALIRQAQRAAAAGGRGGASVASQSAAAPVAIDATPSERRAISHAERARPEAVKLAGGVIHPGVVPVDIASAFSSLPTPLLATLAFLLACLLLVVGGALRNRVRAARSR